MSTSDYYIDHRAEPWKPRNAKGVRHREHCLHDEPGLTICTCGGCRCHDDHEGDCPPRPWTGASGAGRLDIDGIEWYACDPYPTWYRWDGDTLILPDDYFPGWADEPAPTDERSIPGNCPTCGQVLP